MIDAILHSAWQGMLGLLVWFFQSIGWGTVIVFIAGGMLLASLAINGIKVMSRPRGIAVSAAILVAGLIFAWWTWPSAASPPATDGEAATLSQPESLLASKEPVPPKAVQASALVRKPVAEPVAALPLIEPVMFAPSPPVVAALPPLVAVRVHVPPVVVHKPRQPERHKAQPGRTSFSEGRRSPIQPMHPGRPSTHPGRPSGQAGSPNAGFGQAATPLTPQQRRQQAIRRYNAAAERDFGRVFGPMMRGVVGPGGSHMGGMGGSHMGMGHGGGHHR